MKGLNRKRKTRYWIFPWVKTGRKRTESAQAIETKRPAMIVLEEVAAENVKAGPLTMGTKTI